MPNINLDPAEVAAPLPFAERRILLMMAEQGGLSITFNRMQTVPAAARGGGHISGRSKVGGFYGGAHSFRPRIIRVLRVDHAAPASTLHVYNPIFQRRVVAGAGLISTHNLGTF